MSTKTPSPDDIFLAAQWLDIYEGAEDRCVKLYCRKKRDMGATFAVCVKLYFGGGEVRKA